MAIIHKENKEISFIYYKRMSKKMMEFARTDSDIEKITLYDKNRKPIGCILGRFIIDADTQFK